MELLHIYDDSACYRLICEYYVTGTFACFQQSNNCTISIMFTTSTYFFTKQ